MLHTTAAQNDCNMGSMQAAGWCWQTLESIQGCNPNCLATETSAVVAVASRHAVCFTWWWRMPFRPCPVPPAGRWQHLFASYKPACTCLFPTEVGKALHDTNLGRWLNSTQTYIQSHNYCLCSLTCQTFREGGDFCDRVLETRRFCACRLSSPFPMKNYPFSIFCFSVHNGSNSPSPKECVGYLNRMTN